MLGIKGNEAITYHIKLIFNINMIGIFMHLNEEIYL